MKIIVTDCDHDNMIQEEEVFGKAGMTYTHLACKTEDDLIEQAKGGEIMMTQYGPSAPGDELSGTEADPQIRCRSEYH